MIRPKTAKRLSPTDFTRALFALLVTTTVASAGILGCAGTVTPPDSTPVYADEIAPGVERVDVDHQSTTRPIPEKVNADTLPTPAKSEPSDAKNPSSAADATPGLAAPEGRAAPEPAASDAPGSAAK